MQFHWLRLRATSHPTEDPAKVAMALAHATGLDEAALEQLLEATRLETHHGGTQHILRITLQRNRDCREALARILAGHEAAVAGSLEARMDDDGVVYLRLDKQAAAEGRTVLRHCDDPIAVQVKVQVHPFSRQGALEAWRGWLAHARPRPDRPSPPL